MRKNLVSRNARSFARTGALATMAMVGAVAAACSGPAGVTAPAPQASVAAVTTTDTTVAKDSVKAAWRKTMSKVALPSEGCFSASFPDHAWTSVPCATPQPQRRPSLRRAEKRATPEAREVTREARGTAPVDLPLVGDGTDQFASVPGTIAYARGLFPSVTGVTSEETNGTSNLYSLQMNTNGFTSAVCPGTFCDSVMQVLFYGETGIAEIWYVATTPTCPSSDWSFQAPNCYIEMSGYQVNVGAQPITNLAELELFAEPLTINGNSDVQFSMSTAAGMYSAAVPNLIGVGDTWNSVEFNVFGNGGGDEAVINSGATVAVQIEVGGGMAAPSCSPTQNDVTLETNSLSLVPDCCVATPGEFPASGFVPPSITFLETSAGASCSLCGAVGQPCCGEGTGCSSSAATCSGGTCVSCGGAGEPCCAKNECTAGGTTCSSGSCLASPAAPLCTVTTSDCCYSTTLGGETCAAAGPGNVGTSGETIVTCNPLPAAAGTTTLTLERLSPDAESVQSESIPAGVTSTLTDTFSSLANATGWNVTYEVCATNALGSACSAVLTATDGMCGTPEACEPTTCNEGGYTNCGTMSNGCGGTINCGSCATGYTCSSNNCCPTGEAWNGTEGKCTKGITTCKTPIQCCIQAGGTWDGKGCE